MIDFTGERVVPGQVNGDLWAEHFCRYAFAARFSNARLALDIGCGTGYGTAELSRYALRAVGIDISSEAVRYASDHYRNANLTFASASATQLPFPDQSFDLITAFEIIEHLSDWTRLLTEAARLLRPGGVFLVSTPNKLYYGESRGTEGPNPFHQHEFEYEEFQSALHPLFSNAVILLQNHVDGFAIYQHGAEGTADAEIAATSGTPAEAHFFLAVCSNADIRSLHPFVYLPQGTNVLREREHHIRSLELQLAQERHDRQLHIDGLQKELGDIVNAYRNLERDRDEKRAWAERADAELEIARRAIEAAETTVIERTKWAQGLDERIVRLETAHWTRLGRRLRLLPPTEHSSTKKDA